MNLQNDSADFDLRRDIREQSFLARFKAQSRKIRPAVEHLIEEADRIAEQGRAIPMENLFGAEGE